MPGTNESVMYIVNLLLKMTGQGSIKGFMVKREVNNWLEKHPEEAKKILNDVKSYFNNNGPW